VARPKPARGSCRRKSSNRPDQSRQASPLSTLLFCVETHPGTMRMRSSKRKRSETALRQAARYVAYESSQFKGTRHGLRGATTPGGASLRKWSRSARDIFVTYKVACSNACSCTAAFCMTFWLARPVRMRMPCWQPILWKSPKYGRRRNCTISAGTESSMSTNLWRTYLALGVTTPQTAKHGTLM